jgi:Zn-dependent protease
MALAWALLFQLEPWLPEFLGRVAAAGIRVNLILMFLNLLPILPLDGGRVVASLLPARAAWQYAKLEPWGLPLLVLLLVTDTLGKVLWPLVSVSESLLR